MQAMFSVLAMAKFKRKTSPGMMRLMVLGFFMRCGTISGIDGDA
jgi:hypothetical protein